MSPLESSAKPAITELKLYEVSPKDKAEIEKYVSPVIQPPNEKSVKLYKILQEKPI
jgi:hypothetical protein